MATYNSIYSTIPSDLAEGTEDNDSIKVYGNHSTVNALGGADIISVNGGRHDSGIWLEGDETNLINAGAGNDSIYVQSRGASIFGEAGNDTVRIESGYTFADGGTGNDLFHIPQYVNGSSKDFKVTITGGAGMDTIRISPYGDIAEVVITDFSNDDVLRLQESTSYTGNYRRALTQSVENGNVVIRDNSSLRSDYYSDDVITKTVAPLISITLQGVSDISQVANAKYYVYDGDTPKDYKTFGELFGVSDSAVVKPVTETVEPATVEPVSSNTTPTVPATVEPVSVVDTLEPVTETTKSATVKPADTVSTLTDDEEDTNATSDSLTGGKSVTVGTILEIDGKYYKVTEDGYELVGKSIDDNDNGGKTIIVQDGGKYVEGDDNSTNTTSTSTTSATTNTENTTINNIDNSTNTTIINNVNNTYTYNGGDKVINNYQQGEVVQLASDYQGIDVNGNSFLVKSSSGAVEIQNARDKFIGYSATNTDVVAYSYLGAKAGVIDGRDKNQAEIFIGGDHVDNQIYAGNGGSSLWGGNGGTDTLSGGDGYDEFFFAMGSGNDVIQNAGDNDVVNLLGVSLEQITYAEVSSSDIHIGFTDGGHLQLQGQSATGFKLENVTYTANRATGEWTTK